MRDIVQTESATKGQEDLSNTPAKGALLTAVQKCRRKDDPSNRLSTL